MLGVGGIVTAHPSALTWVRWVGAAYLVGYGLRCLWRARRPGALVAGAPAVSRGAALTTVLALTWLNPHVYLDTVLLVGSLANGQGAGGRWWFTAGAALASAAWFVMLGYGARLLAPLFARPVTWRVLDVVIALVMFLVAGTLLLG